MFRRIAEPFIGVAAIIQCRKPVAFQHFEFHVIRRNPAKVADAMHRDRSKVDGRSVSIRLTSKGKKALARDPFEVLVDAVHALDANEQASMHHALHQVLTTVAASGAHRHFGVCPDCTYLGEKIWFRLTTANRSAREWALLGVPIQPKDAGLLCVHFRPKKSEHRDGEHRE
jgi:hypothetical protein